MTPSTRSSKSRTTLISVTFLLALYSFALFNISCTFLYGPDLTWLDYDHESESLIEATRVPKIISSEASDLPTNTHTFQNDGDVTVGIDAPRHPVFDILEHANEEWESLLTAHGGDQTQALLQYRLLRFRKNRRAPGAFTSTSSLNLFTPISPSLISPRQREAEILPDTFTLIIHSGIPSVIYGNLTASVSEEHRTRRVELLLDAIRPFVSSLPDLRATFNVFPHPRHALHSQAIGVLYALSADLSLPNSPVKFRSQAKPSHMDTGHGRPIHEEDIKLLESTMIQEGWSWENACYGQLDIEEAPEEEDERIDFTPIIRFVASPEARNDPCVHRSLTELYPSYESTGGTTYHTRISPIISETTAPWASDVLLPPLDFFAADIQNTARTTPWNNKTAGLFWRSPSTEIPASYSIAQLQHLLDFAQKSEEYNIIIPTDNEGFLIDRKQLTDVVTIDVRQGSSGPEEEAGRKLLIELGSGAQMRTKMASGSLVFRPLLLSDWVSEHSVPWVHYVPVQPDLSDLPSLTAFFQRHDALALRIADAGQAWAREQLTQAQIRDGIRLVLEGLARLGLGLGEQR